MSYIAFTRRTGLGALLLLMLASCQIRYPVGGCPFEDVELAPRFVTPWDTVLEDDVAALTGPFPGTFTWLDGDDVITVPKSGQAIDVEAEVELDLATARMREYFKTSDHKGACEPDRLLIDAELSFIRLDDGEIELALPLTVYREPPPSQYYGDAEITPVEDLAPGLVPLEDQDIEAIFAWTRWDYETGNLFAELEYRGQTTDSPSTGHGSFRLVAEFTPDE